MGRYNVEFKAFKTGEWYVKTSTDYVNSAHSVALTQNYGRAYKVIDTLTGRIEIQHDEEPGAAEASKNYRKY
jgi:hypothetical protein